MGTNGACFAPQKLVLDLEPDRTAILNLVS